MSKQKIIRIFLFVLFFGCGLGALSVSILCDELIDYYQNRKLLEQAEKSLERLQRLNADYDALLEQFQKDPNLFRRIAPAALGAEPADANTIYPPPATEQLTAAREVLKAKAPDRHNCADSDIPCWLDRCAGKPYRAILFTAGTALVFISFIWFGSLAGQKKANHTDST